MLPRFGSPLASAVSFDVPLFPSSPSLIALFFPLKFPLIHLFHFPSFVFICLSGPFLILFNTLYGPEKFFIPFRILRFRRRHTQQRTQ